MPADRSLLKRAEEVLALNDRGNYTQPASGLYPHQWLWDSCFSAIGLSHLDINRAQLELKSLLRGQWHNGMLPNIIFRDDPEYRVDRSVWRSYISPFAPSDTATSGVTQPPMLAEAVFRVGQKLKPAERRDWYKLMYQPLINYHAWLYQERDPHGEGLILLIHPWETGLDNNPVWMSELHEHLLPLWIRLIEYSRLDKVIGLFRRDARSVPLDERYSTIEGLAMFDVQRRLTRKAYDINKILDHSLFTIEDLAFNSILIRANSLLKDIAEAINQKLPTDLIDSINKTNQAYEELWEPYSGQYYSRDFITHRLIKVSTAATFLALYSGIIPKHKADQLVKLLDDKHGFGPAYPVPSVPLDSSWFHPKLYWQGPTWVNMNWLIIDGLDRYGFKEEADKLCQKTLAMVSQSGFSEYFDPISGQAAGADNFSWTAALTIDLLSRKDQSRR